MTERGIYMECFSCAGGMAEGFRRAGIHFDLAIDFEEDHCTSYEKNLGHRPVRMDVRDFLRMVRLGYRIKIRLLVADPPCTPWSRAGKRMGTADERDMLEDTCELIALLEPESYLIGNVPGLDDGKNWNVVQRVIGGLQKHGYCVADFAQLDAADYGVPQHRIRPFWYGHKAGPCIRWPKPSHCDPDLLHTHTLPGVDELLPWVTCKQALGHLSGPDLGRPVRLRKRNQNSTQHGSVPERPARVVGTSNLSDGNVLLSDEGEAGFTPQPTRKIRSADSPAKTITRNTVGDGSVLINDRHLPATLDAPAPAMTAKVRTQSSQILVLQEDPKHPVIAADEPATTIRGGGEGHSAPQVVIAVELHHPPSYADEPAKTVRAGSGGGANRSLVLNDEAPTKRRRKKDERASDKRHPPASADAPSPTVRGSDGGGSKRTLVLKPTEAPMALRRKGSDETPQAYRTSDPNKPAPAVTTKDNRQGNGAVVLEMSTKAADNPRRNNRVHTNAAPSPTVTTDTDRATGNGVKLEWPWDAPSTTVLRDERLPPPGHHPDEGSILSVPGAVIISEKAAAILQGFPQNWIFHGKSKKRRWSQLGQAMPPPLAHAVATSVVEQMAATDAEAGS